MAENKKLIESIIIFDEYESDETFDPPNRKPYTEADEHFWHDSIERARAARWGQEC